MRMPAEQPRSTGREAGPLCLENALNASPKSGEAGGWGAKGQAQRPWNPSSDSSEPAPEEGQVDLTERLSEDGGWEG